MTVYNNFSQSIRNNHLSTIIRGFANDLPNYCMYTKNYFISIARGYQVYVKKLIC